jgi:hypothetical protein
MKIILMLIACLSMVLSAQAKEKIIRLEGIEIKADNEAPQIMYIIPWQSPEGAERLYSPISGGKVKRLKPIDPHTFELELGLHTQWKNPPKAVVDLMP